MIDKWEGFLGSAEPRTLDSSILPDMIISLYWAPDTVLASCKQANTFTNFTDAPAAPKAKYEIKNFTSA